MVVKLGAAYGSRFVCMLTFCLVLPLSGCTATPEPPTTTAVTEPTASVVVTVFASYVVGELTMVGECLTVVDEYQTAYSLVWPPDVSASLDGDVVTITTGLVSGHVKVAQLQIGEQAFIGGGEVSVLDDQLRSSIPESCPAPYWVPGGRIEPAVTETP